MAETEVKRDGDQIVVDLPGVKDRDKARRLVGKTAELRFRPVLARARTRARAPRPRRARRRRSSTTPRPRPPRRRPRPRRPRRAGPGKSIRARAPGDSTSTLGHRRVVEHDRGHDRHHRGRGSGGDDEHDCGADDRRGIPPLTTPAQDKRDATVVLCDREGKLRYQLGPTALTGRTVDSATARFNGGAATAGWSCCRSTRSARRSSTSSRRRRTARRPPQNAVAIVLDGVVQSAPAFQTPSFDGDVQISGNFSQGDAEDLATVLKFGSLPVQLKELTTTSVSPTLGRDQLDAGLLAGAIGLVARRPLHAPLLPAARAGRARRPRASPAWRSTR